MAPSRVLRALSRPLGQRLQGELAFHVPQLNDFLDFNQQEAERLRAVYEAKLSERLQAEQRLQRIHRSIANLQAQLLQHAAATDKNRALQVQRVYRFLREAHAALYGNERPARRRCYRPLPVNHTHAAADQVPETRSLPSRQSSVSTTEDAHALSSVFAGDDARAPHAVTSLESKCREPPASLRLAVIGRAFTPYQKRREAPRQSNMGEALEASIRVSADALQSHSFPAKIQPGDWVWILSYFDRNQGFWRCFIRPPRYRGRGRLGVFATRSPHRPNALGISLVQVKQIREGGELPAASAGTVELLVQGCDLLHDTPILGIQPYHREIQDWPCARVGWLEEGAGLTMPIWDDLKASGGTETRTEVASALVGEKLAWLMERFGSVDIHARLQAVALSLQNADRTQGKGRWFAPGDDGHGSLCFGAYRLRYRYEADTDYLRILDISSGFRQDVLTNPKEQRTDPEVAEHWAFCKRFGLGPAEASESPISF
jgi:tRNA (Thr-GGU) A37 N-methylase